VISTCRRGLSQFKAMRIKMCHLCQLTGLDDDSLQNCIGAVAGLTHYQAPQIIISSRYELYIISTLSMLSNILDK
jgi:hypothetical protein